MNINKISTKLLLAVFALTLILGSAIGFTTYNEAKKSLTRSGKLDMMHLVDTSMAMLTRLNEEVVEGHMSLKDAQNQARDILLGPEIPANDYGQIRDLSKSAFIYKQNSYIFAVRSDLEEVLSAYPYTQKGDESYTASRKINSHLVKIAKAADSDERFDTYEWIDPGQGAKEQVAYMAYFEPWDWNVGMGAYTDELNEDLVSLKWITFGVTLGMMALMMLLFYLASKKIFAIMESISAGSQRIADGDLNIEAFPESKDELGQLSRAFNVMTKNLRALVSNLQHTSADLVGSAQSLDTIADQAHTGIDETSTAMSEIAKGTASTTADIEDLSLNVEELKTAMDQVTLHNEEMIRVTDDSKKATESGMEAVNNLKSSNEASLQASETISKGISNLHGRIRNISMITDTIKSISAQTNLLALNASIEAARAGAHGKGFAVVAEEVRNLAEESSRATAQIENMIKEIEVETDATLTAMDHTLQTSEQLSSQVTEAEKSFGHIAGSVDETAAALQRLVKEVDRISKQSENMVTAIQSVSAVSEQSAASIEEVTASMQEQLTASEGCSQLAKQLTTASQQLEQLIRNYQL